MFGLNIRPNKWLNQKLDEKFEEASSVQDAKSALVTQLLSHYMVL